MKQVAIYIVIAVTAFSAGVKLSNYAGHDARYWNRELHKAMFCYGYTASSEKGTTIESFSECTQKPQDSPLFDALK